jgi:SUMO ligase MMS21 Smc5/6 complex component
VKEKIEAQQEQSKEKIKLNKSLKRGKEATSLAVLFR